MTFIPLLRPSEDCSADGERADVLRRASPVRAAAVTAVVAAAFLAVVALVGLGQIDGGVPRFLDEALGPERTPAPLERTPAPGVGVRIDSEGYTVSRWGASVSVASEDVGGAQWRRHVHGVTRDTEFGAETIVVGTSETEEFLTVATRQGERTWRWRLGTRLVPRVGRDGSIAFLDPTRHLVTGLVIDPVRILDEEGADVTPAGLRWGLEQQGSGWWLTLELDDRDLPLPYVIDPAVTHRNAQTAVQSGGTSLVIPVPAGVQQNDLLVAHLAREGNAAFDAPAGWTAAGGTNSGNFLRQATYYRIATGSEPASYTWTWGGSQAAAGGMSAYYGAKATDPLDVVGTPSAANSATVTAPGITTTTADALVLAFFATRENGTYSTAAGMTERYEIGTAGAASVATDDMAQAAPGATGDKTSTASQSGRNLGHQLSFKVDDVAPAALQSDPGTPLAGTVVLGASASDQDSAVVRVQFQRSPAGAGAWTNIGAADTTSPYTASFDTTTVADGLYDLRAVATDRAGNAGASTPVTDRRIDNTAPSSTTTFPASSGVYRASGWDAGCAASGLCGTYTDGTGSGVQAVEVSVRRGTGSYWDGSGFSSASEVWNAATLAGGSWSYAFDSTDFPADGDYTIRARAVDGAGNAQVPASRTFTYDATAPETTIDSGPADPTASTSADFNFSASEGGSSFECRLDGGSWTACTSPQSYAGLTDGSHDFDVRATDTAGNADASPASQGWTVDTTAPSSTIAFPGAGAALNAGWTDGCAPSGLCGTYSDGTGSGVDAVEVSLRRDSTGLYWNGASFSAGSEQLFAASLGGGSWSLAFPASSFPADGDYTVRVHATDYAGNAEAPASRTFTFDTTSPSGSLTAPADGAAVRGSVAVSSDSADAGSDVASAAFERRPAGGGAWTAIDTDATAPFSVAWDTTAVADGDWELRVVTTDAAGNDTTSATRTVIVDNTAPSAATFDGVPDAIREDVALTGSGADAGSGVASLTYLYCAGASCSPSIPIGSSTTGPGYSVTWSGQPADGDVRVLARVTDVAGNTLDSTVQTVTVDNTSPTGSLTAPPDGGIVSGTTAVSSDSADAGSGVDSAAFERRPAGGGAWVSLGADASAPYSVDWDTTALADGGYDLRVVTTDEAGNSLTSAVRTVTVDNVPPTVSITAPGAYVNGGSADPFAISATSPDADLLQIEFFRCSDASLGCGTGSWLSLGADAVAPYSALWPVDVDGNRALRAVATDGANTGEDVVDVTIDRIDPSSALIAPADGAIVAATVAVSAAASDAGSGVDSVAFDRRPTGGGAWVSIGSDATPPYSLDWDTSAVADGDWELRALTTDAAGNASGSAIRTVTVDNTAPAEPVVTLSESSADAHVSGTTIYLDTAEAGSYDVSATSADAGSGLDKISFPGAVDDSSSPYGTSYGFDDLAPGTHTVTAHDAAGNTASSAFDVVADTAGPAGFALDAPTAGATIANGATVSAAPTDAGAGVARVEFRWCAGPSCDFDEGATIGTPDTTAPFSVAWSGQPADGEYTLVARATDRVGNATDSGGRTVTVDNTGPAAALSVNEGAGTGLQWLDGTGGTLYYNPAADGDFTVAATPADPDEVQSVDFPAVAETGFAGPAKIDLTPPFESDAYSFTSANTDAPADLQVVVTDLLGNPTVLTLAFVRDTTPPAGGSVSYPDGYDADGDVTITVDPGSDALSGLDPASAVLERRTSPLADGACDPFAGAWTTVTSPDILPSGQCAQYRHRVSDRVGNEAVYASSDVVKVDLAAPAAPTLTLDEASPYAHADGTQLYLNTAETGTYQLDAASSDPQSGLQKIAFPGGSEDTSAPYSAGYAFDDLAPGTHTVTAHDHAGNTSTATFDLTPDLDAPATTDDSLVTGSSWQTAPVTVTLTPADGGAGVAATYYTTDGSAPTTSSDEGTTVSLTADGVYTIRYFSVDRVGNAEPVQTAGATIRIDRTGPDAPAIALDESSPWAHVSGDEIFVNTAEAGSYTVSATSADSGSGLERMRFPGGVNDFTSPYSVIVGLGDLSGAQTVTAYDAAGNSASDTFTATPDTAPPAGGSVSYPDGYDADGTIAVSVADGADALAGVDASSGVLERQTAPLADGACEPFAGGWSAVTSPDTVATETCARYRYRISDRVGNEVVYGSPDVVKVDLTPPQTTIDSAPAHPSADDSPGFWFSASETGSTFECRLDGGAWTACTSPESLTGLADGPHTFEVRATDPGGRTDGTPATHAWTVDTDAPQTTVDVAPADPSDDDSPSIEFSADEAGATFECRLDGGAWTSCTSPESLTGLADGPHTFDVRATDAAGNADGTPASHAWTVDTLAPETTLDVVPFDPSADPSPAFEFSASEAGSTFECRLDGGAWTACTSPESLTGLTDGPHTFDVRAADAAGNADATPAQHAWSVNAAPPAVTLVQPSGYVNAADADPYTVRATSPDGDVAGVELFSCSDDSTDCATGTWLSLGTDATAPYEASWPVDADGARALRAVATDAGSNTGEDVVTVTIDRAVPSTTLDSAPPDPSGSGAASFAFSSNEAGAMFECRLDGGAWTACASPETLAGLADGAHTFDVRAADAAGNVDATPADFSWIVDTDAPQTTIDVAPADPSASSAPAFEFSSDEAGSTFECRLDGGAWTPCTSPETLAGLADGPHTFAVRATDAAGNRDTSPASHDWTVDATPPGGGLADPGAYLRGTVALSASPTDSGAGVQGVDFQLSPAGAGTWSSIGVDVSDPYAVSWDTRGEADGAYDLRVVLTDNAGNSTPSAVVEDRMVDNTAPGATMNDPGAYLRTTVTLTSATSDAGSGVASVSYERSPAGAGSWTSVPASWDTTSVADGLYDVRVLVTDNAGNSSASAPVTDRRVDNTRPSLSYSAPADGTTVASAGSLALAASEDVTGVVGAELDGAAAPAPSVTGGSVTYTAAFAEGAHVLSGELEDLAGNRQPIRVHFTVWSGAGTDRPYVEKNSFAAAASSLRSASDEATITVPAGAWTGAPAGDWLVVRLDPQPAGAPAGGFQPVGDSFDATAYWALSGSPVTSFAVPLELEIDNVIEGVVPATLESGAWRALPALPDDDGLPASWADGFELDGTDVRIFTRHLTTFALLHDVQGPATPGDFRGVVSGGRFRLAWSTASDNSGVVAAYRLYSGSKVAKTVGGGARSVSMGRYRTSDARAFRIAAVDEAGNVGTKSYAVKIVPALKELTLAAARKALRTRGFEVGKVTYRRSASVAKGRVVSAPTGLRRAGTKIALVVSAGGGSSRRPVTAVPVAPPSASSPPPASPSPASSAPVPAAPAAPATELAPAAGDRASQSGGVGGFALPFAEVRNVSLAELRQELGFGLLVAAFSVAFAAVLRARRPLRPGAPGDEELLWDVRLLRGIGRALRRLTGR